MLCIVRGVQKGQLGMHITTRQVCIGQEEDRESFMCCHFTRESQALFFLDFPCQNQCSTSMKAAMKAAIANDIPTLRVAV